MLLNFGYDSLNCFTLLLLGEPHLNHILEKPVHEALKQRITIHYSFCGLSAEEVSEYIFHKLSLAGASHSIVPQTCIRAIYSYSQGNPRLIDNLMSDALTLGAQMEKPLLDQEVILAAVNNQALA